MFPVSIEFAFESYLARYLAKQLPYNEVSEN